MVLGARRCCGELAPPTLCAADPSGGPRLSHWGLPSDPVMPPSSRWDSLRTCPLSRRKQSFPVVQRRPRLTAGTHPPSQARAGLSGRTSPAGPCTCPLSLPRACPQAPSFPGASIQVGPPVTPAPQHRCASGTPPQAWRHALQGAPSPAPTQKPGCSGLTSGAIQHPGPGLCCPTRRLLPRVCGG